MKIKTLATTIPAAALLALAPAQPAAAADDTLGAVLGFGAGLITSNSTTQGSNAGELESWSIAAQIAGTAADRLWSHLAEAAPKGQMVMLLGTGQAFDPSAYAVVKGRTRWLKSRLDGVSCPADAKPTDRGATTTSLADLVPKLLGVLKSETSINDRIIQPPEAFWLNALAGRAGGRTIVTPGTLLPNPQAAVASDWLALVKEAGDSSCAQSKDAAAQPGKDVIAEIIAADAMFRKTEPGKMSLLEQASALEALGLGQTPLLMLRSAQQKVGGTLVQTRNILTALGAPGLRIGGGMVITWELTRIEAGGTSARVIAAGNLACTAPMRRLGTVNSTPIAATAAKNCQVSG